jgi:hypothetical protein
MHEGIYTFKASSKAMLMLQAHPPFKKFFEKKILKKKLLKKILKQVCFTTEP